MPAIKVSVLIVSYNTRELTLACLASVYAQTTSHAFEVIVVDNASKDGSADAIASAFPQAILIRSDDNLGFAAGNNLGARRASGEYLLLLNPDTVVLDHAVDRVVDFAIAQPEAKIWGGRTLNADRSLNPASCWRRMTLWSVFCSTAGLSLISSSSLFASEAYGGWDRSTVRQVDIVTGCFLLIRLDFWRQLGGFDTAYFMYGEEADLCLRATKSGAKPMVTPTATIIHYNSPRDLMRPDKIVGIMKAKMTLILSHWAWGARGLGRSLFLLGPLTRYLCYSAAGIVKSSAKTKAATWGEVWKRRAQWARGYSGVRQA